ncbi:SnoaL-like domain-containing protein [Solitalea canadensis]|uniref:SnoaL-like domain-containing protein n=1 Tax=Solitalea canadensis (strain ATCC 29591 / DSM 3403 / JCM 21819 / LMG 8368 / NBRC 15130 / NCIMB 12057 / USAM 9D) TaxID=929556 RepID=H8KX65_SOLCM|nr:SnoaL-like domain-containing protein [Solitalea canadensis]AFD08394.1 hypothetical protein Solca_3387 [Solitalea canadensis DSM 3403]
MSYLEKAKALYVMVGEGKILEAFEKFYSDRVTMEELGEEPRKGKEINLNYEKNWLAGIKEFHGSGVDAITSNEEEGVTMVESWMDLTFQNGQRMNLEQVAVQRWENDHIVYEKFYHK